MENGKILEKNWNDNKLNESLYNCLNIDNSLTSIREFNEKTKTNHLKYLYLKFNFNEENFINDISKIFKENFDNSKLEYDFFNDSYILTTQKDKEKMLDFLSKKYKSIELIYRGTRDGDSSKNFTKNVIIEALLSRYVEKKMEKFLEDIQKLIGKVIIGM